MNIEVLICMLYIAAGIGIVTGIYVIGCTIYDFKHKNDVYYEGQIIRVDNIDLIIEYMRLFENMGIQTDFYYEDGHAKGIRIKIRKFHKDRYEQGRADMLMPYDVESIEELIENVKSKARADVIDETLNKVTKRMSDYLEFDDIKIDWDLFCDEMKEIAEQLKENKNE